MGKDESRPRDMYGAPSKRVSESWWGAHIKREEGCKYRPRERRRKEGDGRILHKDCAIDGKGAVEEEQR